MFFGFVLFMLGLSITLVQSKHLISVFLGMEFMALSAMLISSIAVYSSSSYVLFTMCMAVCEASIALALIVSMVRVHGSDRVMALSLDKS
uniref:NADH-ubiquinone oxidoreductase chain 4L n=1 Tax=Mytilisepta keenae TaxID=2590091 RepID=A0A516EZE1_9BIVA|nr:NADH dehydrogenase subunit 4L [Mytilisepta keenae]QDO71865.1 NADH dehydrogenase subunit 4L [Mytilisepta keenae]